MDLKRKGQQPSDRNPNFKSCDKVNQMLTVFKAFQTDTPKTMLQVNVETGIYRSNICRYVSTLQKQGKIQLSYKSICRISKHRAGYYTTNKELFKSNDNQLKLFEV